MKTKITKKDLEKVIKELNEEIVEPEISLEITEEEMIEEIKKASEFITEDDDLSKHTLKVIGLLKEEKKSIQKQEDVKEKPKGKTKEKPKKKEKVKYTRSDAFVDAVKQGGTKKEIINNIDQYYITHGGETSKNTSESLFTKIIPILIKLDVLQIIDGKYQI